MFFKKWRKRTTITILSSMLLLAGCSVPFAATAKHKTVPTKPVTKSMPGSLIAEDSQFYSLAYDETHGHANSSSAPQAAPKAATPTKIQNRTNLKHTSKSKVTPLFHLHTSKNMQGVTAYGGHVYAGFDLGHSQGEIREYTLSGHLVKDSGPLPIGHSASLSYNQANGLIYVTNGGQTHLTRISEVNMNLKHPKVVRTLDLGAFGHSGLVAIDNVHHKMWVHTAANDHAPITFRYCTMTGKVLKKFTIHNLGVPQGLQVYHGQLYYYTDNKITVLSEQGKILRTLYVHLGGESEGLALVQGTQPYFIFGFHSPNRYYALQHFVSA